VPFKIKRNDLARSLQLSLYYVGEPGTPAQDVAAANTGLSARLAAQGTVVRFLMKKADAPATAAAKVKRSAVVVDAATRTLRYDWALGDTDTSGVYRGEFEVTANGRPETFPTDSYIDIVVYDDVDKTSAVLDGAVAPPATPADVDAFLDGGGP
jgi:hypothetical protein